MTNNAPPLPNLPLVHKLNEFYKDFYITGKEIAKRDRFGAYLKIEEVYLEVQELVIGAAFEHRLRKLPLLASARIKVEVLKRLIRSLNELHIIDDKKFLKFELDLQEISKMVNGWIRSLQ